MKIKAFILILILNIFFSASAVNAISQPSQIRLKGFINKSIRKGHRVEVLPETIFNTEFSLEGDYFSGILSEEDAKDLGVPFESKLIGKVTRIKQAKSFNRDGKIEVHVDGLVLPDGDTVKVDAKFESSHEKPIKHFSKEILEHSAELSAGAAVGALDALRYTGLPTAISTYGISVGAGAALGLGLSLIGTSTKKGDEIANNGFSVSTLKLLDDFVFLEELPEISQTLKAFSAETYGVKIDIKDVRKMFSAELGDFLVIDLSLENKNSKTVHASDIILVSKRHLKPIYSNPLITGLEGFKAIKKNKTKNLKLAFSLSKINKKDNYKLHLIDPISEKVVVNLNVDLNKYI